MTASNIHTVLRAVRDGCVLFFGHRYEVPEALRAHLEDQEVHVDYHVHDASGVRLRTLDNATTCWAPLAVDRDHIAAALTAALDLAHAANSALEAQRRDPGLAPGAYRKCIQDIKALTWCAINDLGQGKRIAVRARRQKTRQQAEQAISDLIRDARERRVQVVGRGKK